MRYPVIYCFYCLAFQPGVEGLPCVFPEVHSFITVLLTDGGNIYCMLEQHPRLNIVKLIDIDHSEGFYCGNTSHCSTLQSDPGVMQ